MDQSKTANLLEFLELVGKLKHIKRTGWLLKNIDDPECIAGHMYRMAIMTYLLDEKQELNRNHCLQLAVIHDLAEAIVGDIYLEVDVETKHRKEDEAMKSMSAMLGEQGSTMYSLYKEYASQSTPEAKFVKDLDRFDMILQAFEYEKRDSTPNTLQEFFDSTKDKFQHPLIVDLVNELNKRRDLHKANE